MCVARGQWLTSLHSWITWPDSRRITKRHPITLQSKQVDSRLHMYVCMYVWMDGNICTMIFLHGMFGRFWSAEEQGADGGGVERKAEKVWDFFESAAANFKEERRKRPRGAILFPPIFWWFPIILICMYCTLWWLFQISEATAPKFQPKFCKKSIEMTEEKFANARFLDRVDKDVQRRLSSEQVEVIYSLRSYVCMYVCMLVCLYWTQVFLNYNFVHNLLSYRALYLLCLVMIVFVSIKLSMYICMYVCVA